MALVRGAGPFGAALNRHSLGPTPGAEAMTLHSSVSAGAVLQLTYTPNHLLQGSQAKARWECDMLPHKQALDTQLRYLVPLTQGHSVAGNSQLLWCHDCHQLNGPHKFVACTQVQLTDRDSCVGHIASGGIPPFCSSLSWISASSEAPRASLYFPSFVLPSRKGLIWTKCSPAPGQRRPWYSSVILILTNAYCHTSAVREHSTMFYETSVVLKLLSGKPADRRLLSLLDTNRAALDDGKLGTLQDIDKKAGLFAPGQLGAAI